MKPDPRDRPDPDSRGSLGPIIAVIVVLALLAALVYTFWPRVEDLSEQVLEEPVPAEPAPEPAAAPEPEQQPPQYPVPGPEQAPQPPEADSAGPETDPSADGAGETAGEDAETSTAQSTLPPLAESDNTVRESMDEIVARNRFEELFIPESLIRHFVVTVDNMTRTKLPQKYSFTQPPPKSFMVQEVDDDTWHIDPANYARYERFVLLAENVSLDRLVAIYTRYYPLFQQAYEELGYPDRYFNDRLVEVIDHLLSAPAVERPVELVRPKVFYQFADPRLEDMSAGRKLLIRMGPDNAARLKDVLQRLRDRLTSLGEAQLN